MRRSLLCLFIVMNSCALFAQKKIVVMGSSTAAGQGSSSEANSWVGKLRAYYRQNMGDGLDTTVTSIAISGATTYAEMPDGFVSTIANRPAVNTNNNVTRALSYNPHIIIINLPTNDIANGYSKKECMDNFRTMFQAITAAGVKCYITTSQPRTLDPILRDSLKTLADSVIAKFGNRSINFWSDLVTTDGSNLIRPEVAVGDGIHINDLGHDLIYIRTRNRNIFADDIVLPVTLSDFKATLNKNSTVSLKWKASREEPGTMFELQRSSDGSNFQPLYQLAAISGGRDNEYAWTDMHPFTGKNYYRLKISEPNRVLYSDIVAVTYKNPVIKFTKVYLPNPSTLITEIGLDKSQNARLRIINAAGVVVLEQSQFIRSPSKLIELPVGKLSSGLYYLSITLADNSSGSIGFVK